MRGFKNHISILFPNGLFLLSNSNEGKTDGDIMEMGERLAHEVRRFILENCPGEQLQKLTFVGHSMGGLICRAAFPLLVPFKDKFNTFMTLGSPHLGYMYNSSKLFETGMWFMRKWNKSLSLTQLAMQDESVFERTLLYRLSEMPGLGWFDNIVLVCSNQDQYVPFDSARIQLCPEAMKDNTGSKSSGTQYIQMSWNLMQKLKAKLVYRVDADFEI